MEVVVVAGVIVSREVPVPRPVVWDLLWDGGPRAQPRTGPAAGARVRLGGTLLELDVVDPVEGFSGSAVWGGVAHRVAAHLVERGTATLLVLTAEPEDPDLDHGPLLVGGGRSALAHRHALRDLAALADRVLRGAGAVTGV